MAAIDLYLGSTGGMHVGGYGSSMRYLASVMENEVPEVFDHQL